MRLIHFQTLGEFLDGAMPLLLAHEIEHGLMLGIAGEALPSPPGASPYLALVVSDAQPVAAAMRTAYKLVISRELEHRAMAVIARDVAEPGLIVLGPTREVEIFTGTLSAERGAVWSSGMAQRIHAATGVRPRERPDGAMRIASTSDRELLLEWSRAFTIAHERVADDRAIATALDSRLSARHVHVWEVDGRPVSMAVAVGRTPNGIRIGGVYTPVELRNRGYAGALVADLTQRLLDDGSAFVFLYTDLADPIANRLYAHIGYEPVADVAERIWTVA